MLRRMIFPLALGLVGCAILISLGIWQMQRLAWKEAMLAEIEAKIHNAPLALPEAPDPARDRYLAVIAQGAFTGQVALVITSSRDGVAGVRVIEAFQTDTGRKVLVDRGFLPDEERTRAFAVEPAAVTGNLDWPRETDSYTPPPDAKTGLWFARDVPAMAKALGTEPTLIVAVGPVVDGIAPMPVDTSAIPNDHKGYAITWFSLAVVWAVMTGFLLWRIRQRKA